MPHVPRRLRQKCSSVVNAWHTETVRRVHLDLHVTVRPLESGEPGYTGVCEEVNIMTEAATFPELVKTVDDMIRGFFVACRKQGTLDEVVARVLAGKPLTGPVSPRSEPTPPIELVTEYQLKKKFHQTV